MHQYKTYNKYVIRKPLFSYDLLFDNGRTKNIESVVENLIDDDTFVTSIYWSSPDLYKTIKRYREKTLTENKIPRLLHTLKKYAIRCSTRCTPYGTMAGISLQDLNKSRKPEPLSRKARVDMDFLAEIKFKIETHENIRKNLKYRVNNTLGKIPGQYRYQELVRTGDQEEYQLSSLEITEYLERISRVSRFMKYNDIKNLLSDDFDDHAISGFIDELISIDFLVSELQLSLTAENTDPIENVLKELLHEGIHEVGIYLEVLAAIKKCISAIEKTDLSYLPLAEISELENLSRKIGINKTHFFHVDMKHSSESNFELDEKMLRNISTSVSLVNRLSSGKSGQHDLETFKKYFHTRYDSREVSLTEVLDPEFGIGFPAGPQIGNFQGSSLIEGLAKEIKPAQGYGDHSGPNFLLELIEKENSKTEIINLENIHIKGDEKPIRVRNLFVIGSPVKDHFFLQNIGTAPATSVLGRFALLDDEIKDLCDEIYRSEQGNEDKAVFAEVIYIPEKRTANITRRPRFSDYEIPIFAGSSNDDRQILLKDIMISVQGGEIVLRSESLNKRVIPRLSNAHNFYKSETTVYKFLCALQSQNQKSINLNINYSEIKKRFIPRIVYRNIILHRACWILHDDDIKTIKSSEKPLAALKDFLHKWKVSKYIVLVQGDHELFLDSTHDSYLLLLLDELKSNTMLQLSEWLSPSGPEKNYNQQIILPLKNTEQQPYTEWFQHKKSSVPRSFAPGSEWLYLKLYCNSNISDRLLSGLQPLINEFIEEKKITKTFFIRYTDPHYHIRIRFHLADKAFFASVLHRLHEYLDPYFQNEIIWNLVIDSYHREIERYHPEYMEAAEEAFYHDSLLVLYLLGQENFAENENTRLFAAVKNINSWLSLFGLSLQERLNFCKSMENVFSGEFSSELKSGINAKYRLLKEPLHEFCTGNEFGAAFHQRDLYLQDMKLYREALSSYIHMSINRWFSSEQRALEFMAYSFATKYYSRILSQSK